MDDCDTAMTRLSALPLPISNSDPDVTDSSLVPSGHASMIGKTRLPAVPMLAHVIEIWLTLHPGDKQLNAGPRHCLAGHCGVELQIYESVKPGIRSASVGHLRKNVTNSTGRFA